MRANEVGIDLIADDRNLRGWQAEGFRALQKAAFERFFCPAEVWDAQRGTEAGHTLWVVVVGEHHHLNARVEISFDQAALRIGGLCHFIGRQSAVKIQNKAAHASLFQLFGRDLKNIGISEIGNETRHARLPPS